MFDKIKQTISQKVVIMYQFFKDVLKLLINAHKYLPIFVQQDIKRTANLITVVAILILSIVPISIAFDIGYVDGKELAIEKLEIKIRQYNEENKALVEEIRTNEVLTTARIQEMKDLKDANSG